MSLGGWESLLECGSGFLGGAGMCLATDALLDSLGGGTGGGCEVGEGACLGGLGYGGGFDGGVLLCSRARLTSTRRES